MFISALVALFINFTRVDVENFQSDPGFGAYTSMLRMDAEYNHPVVIFASYHMQQGLLSSSIPPRDENALLFL
jgi:hypothetical protein